MNKYIISLGIIFGSGLSTFATIRYVKPIPTGTGTGLSWANASNNLQDIINASSSGDQVWVAAGTYKPSDYPQNCPSCSSVRDYSFHLQGGVKMYGGFLGNESAISERNLSVNHTILSGDIGSAEPADDNVFHVFVYTADIANSELDGFSITKGGTKTYISGSGVVIDGKSTQQINGGGGFIIGSGLSIKNCDFSNHTAYSGAGLVVSASNNISIDKCRFNNNQTLGGYGGGLGIIGCLMTINNSVFDHNIGGGGGVSVFTSGTYYPVFQNCVITENSSIGLAGGIYIYGGVGDTAFINCTVSKNSSNGLGAIYLTDGAAAIFKNIIVWNNTNTQTNMPTGIEYANASPASMVSNSIVQGGFSPCSSCPSTNGNVDPKFVNATSTFGIDNLPATFDDGLSLKNTSPAINTGDNSVTSLLDILDRQKVGIKDIGAYEFMPKNECVMHRFVGDVPIENGTHNSTFEIVAVGTAGIGTNVSLEAANQVLLLPGFKTESTAVFTAKIQNNCSF